MKKKMVTMLMIGTMAVMTACGTASKNDTLSDTTTVETDGNVKEDKSENDTKKDDAEAVSVDDVKFDSRDLIINGGGTYKVKQIYDSQNISSTIHNEWEKNYVSNIDEGLLHTWGYTSLSRNNDTETITYDKYQDNNNNMVYDYSSETNLVTKTHKDNLAFVCEAVASNWQEIFNLPWTLSSETTDEFIFTLSEDTDFTELLDKEEIEYGYDPNISNLTASYVYSKNGTKLQSINIEFYLNKIDNEGNPYTPYYSFSLTSSNLGNTTVEIPEEIINNAVEE